MMAKEDSEWLAYVASNYISRSEELLGGLGPEMFALNMTSDLSEGFAV